MVMPGLGWIFLFAIVALGVSILGIYAACSEKVLMLTIVSTRVHIKQDNEESDTCLSFCC